MCFIFFELRCSIQDLISWNVGTLNPWVAILRWATSDQKAVDWISRNQPRWRWASFPAAWWMEIRSLTKASPWLQTIVNHKQTYTKATPMQLSPQFWLHFWCPWSCAFRACVLERRNFIPKQIRKTSCQSLSHFVKPVCVWGRNKSFFDVHIMLLLNLVYMYYFT